MTDVNEILDMRDDVAKALNEAGLKSTDSGGGLGSVDLWFERNGTEYVMSIAPVKANQSDADINKFDVGQAA